MQQQSTDDYVSHEKERLSDLYSKQDFNFLSRPLYFFSKFLFLHNHFIQSVGSHRMQKNKTPLRA
jgi:hypothetical protein